jgi:hypothetical protein
MLQESDVTRWTSDQGRYLYTQDNANTEETRAYILASSGIRLTIPMFERAKTFHASDHAATVEVEVTLRPTVSRPVRLGVRPPSGTRDQFFFLLEIFFRQLRVCYFVAPSLTIGRVCNLLLLLVFPSAVPLGSALSDERSGLSFVSISL